VRALELAGWLCAAAAGGNLVLWRARLASRMALVAEASHELRGPLTAVQIGLAGLARDAGAGSARRRVAALELELRRAGRALEDLAAAPSGRRAPERPGPVDVADLLEETGDAWAAVAAAFGTRVRVESPAEWWVVRADRVRLAQALGNLVANAIEHGLGPVVLRARSAPTGLRLEVSDAGPGVPVPRPVPPRRTGSRGHGLAIAARVAEAYGGRLILEPSATGGHLAALELPAPAPGGPYLTGRNARAAIPFRFGPASRKVPTRIDGPAGYLRTRPHLRVPER
jgi:signal transduction histidine kinase